MLSAATHATEVSARVGVRSTVLRVAQEERYVGDILLNQRGRVWRHASSIPADVVLKVLVAHRRQGDLCGQFLSRLDGRNYRWFLVGLGADEAMV
ncbi:MAG: hypothetical protein U0840_30615 [Gemmataceae bacterium]